MTTSSEISPATGNRFADRIFAAIVSAVEALARLHPVTDPKRHGVTVIEHEPYLLSGDESHSLDIYVPEKQLPSKPCVLYIHGGSFRNLSKEILWFAALKFARQGYVVFNLEYRRGTRHYPACIADVCAAATWVHKYGAKYGANPDQLIIAGESAGGNLALALTLACSYARKERWAKAVWDAGIRPRAAAIACGILQVSEPERFEVKGLLGAWISDCIADATANYLPNRQAVAGQYPLADPVVLLEEEVDPPTRPLPPMFVACGAADPLQLDSQRLASALDRMGVMHDLRLYKGAGHGFHVLTPWTRRASELWTDQFAFLQKALDESRG